MGGQAADRQVGRLPDRRAPRRAEGRHGDGGQVSATVTGLSEQQVLGQIQAAPPSDFLSLLTLSPAEFTALWPRLSKVPGLSHQQRNERLFSSPAQEVVGQVGTEDSAELRAEGAAYQPGMTVGLTGLQQALPGRADRHADDLGRGGERGGRTVATLWNSPGGHAGTPVRTTLNSKQQTAAMTALAGAVELRRDRRARRAHRGHQGPRLPCRRSQRAAAVGRHARRQGRAGHGVQHRVRGGAAVQGHRHEPPAAVRAGRQRRR